ncbi:MAG: hypothetical protein RMJ14_05865 [Nitrososphaerota archaeon]|nr:hypothetical protein [Aigarchaeota archaeon]MDW8077140.1 hypothetical protein [Nitrososphaerota archaeon]
MQIERPFGVTVLAILEIIAGLILIGIGAIIGAAGMMAGVIPYVGWVFGPIFIALAVIIIILGLISFVVAYGLWTGKGWAWTVALILSIIGIIINLFSLPGGIVGIIINVIIIYYLTRPHVKAFFGKAPPPPPPPPPPA